MIPHLDKAVLFEPLSFPDSAWLGHLPFACWLTVVTKPKIFVELGTERGASYFAFCQTITKEQISARAFAVDTWQGDVQSGFYDESIYRAVHEHNSKHYAAFSELIRGAFDQALDRFDDGTIDLLHIDGYHSYKSVRHDFESWLPKMSDRGVILMHDTAVKEVDYGVGRLFAELGTKFPTFSFSHAHGLGIVGVGPNIPAELDFILGKSFTNEEGTAFSNLFARLGSTFVDRKLRELGRDVVRPAANPVEGPVAKLAGTSIEKPKPVAVYRTSEEPLISRAIDAWHKRGWAGLRDGARDWLSRKRVALQLTLSPPAVGVSGDQKAERALLFSGEPNTPGHAFRVERLAHALESLGYHCLVACNLEDAERALANEPCALLWVWRTPHTMGLESLMVRARSSGVTVLYDCDDLMFEPDLATPEIIDGIRSGKYDSQEVASHYARVRRAMLLADGFTGPTRPLIRAMRRHFRPAFVLANTFDVSSHDSSAEAYWRREREFPEDDIIRIGYAAGTLTHQKDFLKAVEGIAACLREDSRLRLVLFKTPGRPTLDVSEFPELAELDKQIEWRDFVSMDQLPAEMGRFDINIAPLESGNPYVEAKSELKYFDAALVRVPTVASPTHPYRTAIQNGLNGLLAETPEEWRQCVWNLASNRELREEMGRRAYFHAIAKYGPLAKARAVRRAIAMMRGSSHDAAVNFQAEIAHQARHWTAPICSDAEVIWSHRSGRCARAAVVMPLYNYRDFVIEALDSVFDQSLSELELIVVDDASTDNSLRLAKEWMEARRDRFCQVAIFRNRVNSGLGSTRNRAIAESAALHVMPLDADNKLEEQCIERLLDALQRSDAALAYPLIRHFGDSDGQMGYHDWHPLLFSSQNYIDAMAMLNKSAWSDVGGYDTERTGWEDYDFNCRLVEAGYWGLKVSAAHAFYRVHRHSMVRTLTEREDTRGKIADRYRRSHPWIDIAGY